MQKRTIFFGLILSCILLVFFFGCIKPQREIKIGAILSLSGPTATYGDACLKGIKLALEEINSTGIKGKRLEIVVEDNRGEESIAPQLLNKLSDRDKVLAILGPLESSTSLAVASLAQTAKIPLLTPTATNPKVTEVGDYISRICYIDPFQGEVMANFAYKSLKIKNAAVIFDSQSEYSQGLANFFIKKFKGFGGNIIFQDSYREGEINFTRQIEGLKRAKPEAIFMPGYYTEVGLFLKQAKEKGLSSVMLGGDGWDSPKLFEIAGQVLESKEGSYICSHFSIDDPDTQVQIFVKKFKGKYDETPNAMAALGYDAAMVLADAIRRALGMNREAIKEAINSTYRFPGVTGLISLDEKRNAVKSGIVLKAEKNRFVFLEKINP